VTCLRSVARTVAALLVAIVPLGVPGPVAAADVTFGRGTADARFGEGIEFTMPVTLGDEVRRVELLVTFPDALGPQVEEVAVPATRSATLRYRWDLLEDGHLVPNTTLEARWRVTPADGEPVVSAPTRIVYADTRFTWRTLEGDVVRVHWYDGSEAFGRRALEIGEGAVEETARLLGVTEDEPIDFFIYPDEAAFRDALGPGTRENVGGQAHADIRTLFALISPAEIDAGWVSIVVPHELVHLVLDTTVDNPYRFPPRWLNEGLAVYLSQGYDASDRARVEDAAREGSLIPLAGLTGQFPTTFDRFALAYAESVAAVDHLVRRHGRDALIGLVRSYQEGLTDDEAFERAIGMDVEAFQAGWFDELGAAEPVRYGPQAAPAGPVPPGWEDAPATRVPGSDPAGGRTAAPPDRPATPVPGRDADDAIVPLVAVSIVLVSLAGFVLFVVARRLRPRRHDAP